MKVIDFFFRQPLILEYIDADVVPEQMPNQSYVHGSDNIVPQAETKMVNIKHIIYFTINTTCLHLKQ